MVACAKSFVCNGSLLTAALRNGTSTALQDPGPASAGQTQPCHHPSVSGSNQHPSPAAGPVLYPPSIYYSNPSLSTVGSVPPLSVAQGYENSTQTYGCYQPPAVNTSFLPNGQSQLSAYEETGSHNGPNLHWREAPPLWPRQAGYPGSGCGAGPCIPLEEPHVASGRPLWVPSHPILPQPQYMPGTGAVPYPVSSVMPMDLSQLVPGPAHPVQFAWCAPSQTTRINEDGMPVNVKHGVVPTEARGVFIQNLSYEATSADVERLMRDVGRTVRCEINTQTGTGRSKGSATVTFTRAEDAIKALAMFNGTPFMGRLLTVRLDKNKHPNSDAELSTRASSGPNEPIIVDGSTGSG